LDFFSEKEFEAKEITPLIKKGKNALGFKDIDFQQSFNRNIFYLNFNGKKTLKTEFTYFPFPRIEESNLKEGIFIDNLRDIAVNKVFTVNQNPRGRDFFDLYLIMKKEKWDIADLLKQARNKFDSRIDEFHFSSQLFKVNKLLDDPILFRANFNHKQVEEFFTNMSRQIGSKAIKK
jgi:hypothetical protein